VGGEGGDAVGEMAGISTVCMTSTRWTLRRVSTKCRLEEAVVLDLQAWEEEDVIDLSDEMNVGPLIVLPNTPASRVFHLFSAMGLRHLPVVSPDGEVVGMITRHDLHRFQQLIDSRRADRSTDYDELNGDHAL
jgi:CBS domain-containing protein